MTNIPTWLTEQEQYQPKKDNSNFINKSSKALMKTLSSFKRNSNNKKADGVNISIRLFGMLIFIILTSVSRNISFVLFMIALTVVRIAILDGEKIKSYLKTIIPVILLSFLIILPSVFIGNPKTLLTIVSKIFVSVSIVTIVNLTSNFNDITRALKAFRVPDIVIFTFDLAIKYISILGEICSEMLIALKVRSIGKNSDKKGVSSGILGTVFIKAKKSADDTNNAMICRGFNGNYVIPKKKFKFKKYDLLFIILFAIIVAGFIYLEVII